MLFIPGYARRVIGRPGIVGILYKIKVIFHNFINKRLLNERPHILNHFQLCLIFEDVWH